MASTRDRHPPPPPAESPTVWSEEDELHLLEAVLEIAEESPQDYDASISLFLRIRRRLGEAFDNEEVLKKVKDLRRTYESGGLDQVQGTISSSGHRIRELCAKIWGDIVIEIPPPPSTPPLPSPPPPPQVEVNGNGS